MSVSRSTYRLLAPAPGAPAAIAIIQLSGDLDAAFSHLTIQPVPIGALALRNLAGIDRALIARWSADTAYLMPHAGPAVLRNLLAALERAAIAPHPADSATGHLFLYPEARSDIEARALNALARAASPLAIDLLLDQPRRWAALPTNPERKRAGIRPAAHTPASSPTQSAEQTSSSPERSEEHPPVKPGPRRSGRTTPSSNVPPTLEPAAADPRFAPSLLNRLLHPPLIVALGRPNIGKSSLLNALAGRAVALVEDAPGTTRDHVGVSLNLAGLVVRYLDTPGLDPDSSASDPIQSDAQSIALHSAAAANFLLLCADHSQPFPDNPYPHLPALRLALRADLGPPCQPRATDFGSGGGAKSVLLSPYTHPDLSVSIHAPATLSTLIATLRDRLVPPEVLADPRPWRFW